ncbi:addiction module protein [Litoribacter ruber]|uniref:Addiction module protein n=1 Tax=Litoribacter ruber TaxID=702568 RepID=A0AAP2CJ95_9BACT|nr:MULTISPECIES: addiction module protein [Litoribacter]MBS9523605.1 addiction module protein [Litoribacter alkaliphilus]MBT0811991.1 addiction module protein [Litoribacter ruber]
MEKILKDILQLSEAERILIAEAIWDSLPEESEPEFTTEQKDEIKRRIDKYDRGESTTYSWSEVKDSLKEHK